MRKAAQILAIGAMGAGLGLISGVSLAEKLNASVKAERVPDTSLLIQNLGRGKLMVNGKEWDAKKYCNEQSIANPEQIELYALSDKKWVVLCTGAVAGEANVVTLFPTSGWPKTMTLKPKKKKSAKISDDEFRKAVRGLLRN